MDFIFELISEYSYIYITYIVLLCKKIAFPQKNLT